MHPPKLFTRIASLLTVLASAAMAVPTAVNDSFTTAEDTAVAGGTVNTPILVTSFDAGGGSFPLPANWDYLDTIPAAATTYPVDGAAVDWKAKAFDKTTSTVAGWKSAAMPIQGGGVDAWPNAPSVLLGITGGGGVNTVNTYLFRTSFTMTAAEAATAWTARLLADDACIVYVNGVEAGRYNYDTGLATNPSVLVGGNGGSETAYTDVPLTVPFTAGQNTIAIELHQNTNNSSDAGLDFSLSPTTANPLQGLAYADDVDGTNRPNSAAGSQDSAGNPGSAINVVLSRGFGGGGNGNNVSGGWRKTINVPTAGTLKIKCDARARALNGLESDEFAEAIIMLDGARLQYSGRNYLVRQVGANTTAGANGEADSGWASYTIETPVTAGDHTIVFGAFGPRPSGENFDFDENGTVNFDNINVSLVGTGGSLLDNDTGGVAPVTAVKVSDPEFGALTFNANGNFNYVPQANWNGVDQFTYRAVDSTGQSNVATVSITVTPVNDLPVAVDDGPYTTQQNTAVTVPAAQGLLVNDTDVDNPAASLTAALAVPSANGTTVVNPNGSFTFTPNTGFAGSAVFTYRTSDGTGQSAPATVTINVLDEPDPPVGNTDTYTAIKNTPLVVTATTPGNTTEEILPLKAANWHYFDSLVLAERNLGTAWRTTTYIEDANWKIGAAELGYGDGDEATTINDNPTPAFDSGATDKFATYYFRRTINIPDLYNVTSLLVDAVFDDGIVIFMNGTEIARNTGLVGQGAELAWDYFSGNASNNEQATQAWTLPVTSLVDGDNLLATEVHQTQASSSDISMDVRVRVVRATAAGVLANDTDPDAGQTATLVAEIVAQPAHGTVNLNTNGTFTYTPANGYTGADSFTYRAKDTTDRLSAVTTANITVVTGPNVAPVANADSYTTSEETELNVNKLAAGVLGNDTDAEGDPFTAVVLSSPSHGTLTLNPNGTFIYTPATNFSGVDTFTYRATDGKFSAPAVVSITVTPVNDVPVAQNDSYSGDPGVPFTVAAAQGVLANDTDADPGTALTAELVSAPASGNLVLNPDGSFTFTVAQGGTYTFTYRAKDATTQSNTATVTISLNAVPVTQPDAYTTPEDEMLHGEAAEGHSVLGNDSDPEGQPLTAVLVTNVQHGTLTFEADGGFHYQPAANFFGTDSFTYRASDGTRTSAPQTATITVTAVNDAPVANADIYGVRVDTPLVLSAGSGVLRNDTDVDNQNLTAVLVAGPADGTLALNPDGGFTYTPAAGFSGTASFTYKATDGTLQSSVATVTLNVSVDMNTIAISEIMYNPPGATGVDEEFIEIYNYGDSAVDLTGWEFTKGVNYAFPAGQLIPSRGYLAIPANKTAFTAKYPGVTAVTANGWGTASTLANGGETIRLRNAAGDQVDEVTYSDQGDWAVRKLVNVWRATNTPGAAPAPVGNLGTNPGLEWVTTADPNAEIGNTGGGSIQLINNSLSNKCGQNWSAATPTPGAPNTAVAQTNSAPFIRDVTHSPAVPNATQQVYVTAKIEDELLSGYSASVFYRTWTSNSTTPDSTTFTEVPMADNGLRGDGAAGDGVFGGIIPAQALDKVVEFYVRAVDAGSNARTWPAPTLDLNGANPVQNANCLYQVNTEAWTDHRALYQVIMTGADNSSWNAGRGDSQSNVAPNCTVIFRQGGKFDVRYLGGIRTRGNSSRSENPVNLRMEVPGDTPWKGRAAFTLNVKYSYSQALASRLFESGGIPSESGTVVGVRINGLNRCLDSTNNRNRNYGYYCDLIPRGGDVINRWFPDNNDGNGYGKIRGSARWRVSTLPTIGAGGYAVGGYVNEGYWKQTNKVQNDWTDLHAWMTSLNAGTAADFDTTIASTVDVDQWCRFLAMSAIVNHAETNMANGDDDDYSLYFGATDRLARVIAHDLDTCFNLNAIGLGDEDAQPTATIYQCTDGAYPAGDGATLPQMDKFYRNPVLGRKYKAALRHYLDTIFAKARFDATVDEVLDSNWMGTQYNPTGDAIRTHIKSFMDTRRTTIATFLPTAFTATTTLAVQNGYARSTSATDLGSLGGKIDPARTAEVRVNGIKVTTNPYGSTGATDNSWSAGTAVTLNPGLNNLVCTAIDENGSVFATQTVAIWYDTAGTNKSGTLAASETWTAPGGPYNVTANLTVPSGVTLTIEPGTTIYSASAVDIAVSAGGRIVAQGTPAAGITFTRIPSGTGNWGGITISGASTQPTILSYVTFENNGDTAVHTQSGANVEFDHLTFKNTAEQYLSLDGSSFYVRDCIFPDATAAFEPVHGTGGIAAGGRGIVKNCSFGKPVGYNDSMDFTGGNRPGPILHVINCTFNGSEDDMLDLDSTDAWIEGCTFIHCHRNGTSPDSSSGVSGGADNSDASQVTVINCLFYDCDNAVTMKQGSQPNGNSAVLINNTIVHITKTGGIDTGSGAVNFDDDNVGGEGKGFYLEGNIIWDVENLTRNWVPANSAFILNNNLLPSAAPAEAGGSGNTVGDPLLNLSAISNPATATIAEVQAALRPLSCSPAIGTGVLGANKGADLTRVNGIYIKALPAAVVPPSLTLTVGPGGSFTPTGQAAWDYGYTAYKYSLDNAAAGPETPVSTPISLTGLSAGPHTLSVWGRDDGGIWQESPTTWEFDVAAGVPTVVINEILADSTTAADFIELYNWGSAPASLNGCTLSDDPANPGLFAFAAAATIPAGGYLVVDATQLGFSLNRGGETVSFYGPGGLLVDGVPFGPQITNFSLSRVGNTGLPATPTPGAPNTGACRLGNPATVKINEWLGNNDIIVDGDFVELYNPDVNPVRVDGWSVTQDFRNAPMQNAFPENSFIAGSGFLALTADANRAAGPDHLSFKVSSLHDSIALVNPSGAVADDVLVLPGNPDVSQGRTTDGGAVMGYLALPTPGFSNASNVSADTLLMNGLRITELMFAPTGNDPEFIEFKNISGASLTITGVNFASGITFTFPAMTLPAGSYGVITNSLAAFNIRYPGVSATQWTSGRLDNNGESIRVETGAFGFGILDFRYEGDWYPDTRTGASLEFINPDQAARSTWGDKASWQPSVPSPGTVGAFGVVAPPDFTVAVNTPAPLHGFVYAGTYAPGAITVAWSKLSGPGSVVFTAPANRDSDVTFSAAGSYEIQFTATPPGGAPAVTDTVLVTVTSPVENYAAWAARLLSGVPADQRTAGADPDKDGVPNSVELILGTDPLASSAGPEVVNNGGRLALRYNVSKTADPAIQVIPQISTDAAAWQDGAAVITDAVTGDTGAALTHTATDNALISTGVRKFMRLKVVVPQP